MENLNGIRSPNDDFVNSSNENAQTTASNIQEENDTHAVCGGSNARADTNIADNIHVLLQKKGLSESDKKLINAASFYMTREWSAVRKNCTVKIKCSGGNILIVKEGNGKNVLSVQMDPEGKQCCCYWEDRENRYLNIREGFKDIYHSEIVSFICKDLEITAVCIVLSNLKKIWKWVKWPFKRPEIMPEPAAEEPRETLLRATT